MFSFLGHSRGKPIDASKFEPTTYSFNIEASPRKDLQWLLIHLYYLCLKHLPSLTKSWWIDCSLRQTKPQVETWTEKYVRISHSLPPNPSKAHHEPPVLPDPHP